MKFRLLVSLWVVAVLATRPGPAAESEILITEPASVTQYADAIVIYLHGFDVMRARYPALELRYRFVDSDGMLGPEHILDVTESWEKAGIILRKDGTEHAGILLSAMDGPEVFFRRLYPLGGTLNPAPRIATQAENAVIEPGQFMDTAPVIAQPDLALLDTVTIGAADRLVAASSNTYQAISDINYPLVASGQNGPLSLQTDHPTGLTRRSLYVPLRVQYYDQVTGEPGEVRQFLCEVPLDPDWLNGTEDLEVQLAPGDIKVHWTQQEYGGRNILPNGRGGLGQSSGTMSRDANFNIYWTGVPSQIVRFNPTTAEFEIPPVDIKNPDVRRSTHAGGSPWGSGKPESGWTLWFLPHDLQHEPHRAEAHDIFLGAEPALQPRVFLGRHVDSSAGPLGRSRCLRGGVPLSRGGLADRAP